MTVTTFKDALSDLVITGVTRQVDIIEIDAELADLPLQYVTLPSSDNSFFTFGRININPIRTCDLVVLVRPVALGTNTQNQIDLKTMADNVVTALEGAIADAVIDSFTLALDPRTIHGTDYLAVVATVTGRDK